MRLPVLAAIAMSAASGWASAGTYELALDLSMEGKHIASPRLVVEEGVKSSVQINDTFIDLVAKDAPKMHGILVSFSIGKTDGGTRTVIATPAVVAPVGQRAEVRIGTEPGAEPLILAVTARPQAR